MNIEIIKTLAADAIADFARTHDSSCVLSIEDGLVVAKKFDLVTTNPDRTLVITRVDQNSGLTAAKCSIVGNKLFNLYIKELVCRTHQKP